MSVKAAGLCDMRPYWVGRAVKLETLHGSGAAERLSLRLGL